MTGELGESDERFKGLYDEHRGLQDSVNTLNRENLELGGRLEKVTDFLAKWVTGGFDHDVSNAELVEAGIITPETARTGAKKEYKGSKKEA